MQDFKKLEIYNESRNLALELYDMTKSRDLNFISLNDYAKISEKVNKISRMLFLFIKKLNTRKTINE